MSQDPDPFFVENGTAFAVNSTNLIVGAAAVDDIICFFNTSDSGGMNIVLYIPDLYGAQLYSGPEGSPTMLTGTFYLTDATGDIYTLNVTNAPEPMTWLLLASGLAALALKRKKFLANYPRAAASRSITKKPPGHKGRLFCCSNSRGEAARLC
jgi:hypothetical protein